MSARCLSTYVALPEEGYSTAALARLSDGRAFPHRLAFDRKQVGVLRAETMTRMSISGVQDKLSLSLHRGKLTVVGRDGHYILKPVPSLPLPALLDDVPANESLTMQLAEQVFGIETAANALIRLADGELAYITRRFDRTRDGRRVAQEDFCQLMERSPETHGKSFKYDASYEELARALRRFCGAYAIESEKLFRVIAFNYLVGNGDAHLKNFSLRRSSFGDYLLSPAYDLLSTAIHIPTESRLALDLFANGRIPRGVETHGFVTSGDLLQLGQRMELADHRAEAIVGDVSGHVDETTDLIHRSLLSDAGKTAYTKVIEDRRRALRLR